MRCALSLTEMVDLFCQGTIKFEICYSFYKSLSKMMLTKIMSLSLKGSS